MVSPWLTSDVSHGVTNQVPCRVRCAALCATGTWYFGMRSSKLAGSHLVSRLRRADRVASNGCHAARGILQSVKKVMPAILQRVCVFCGSSPGADPAYGIQAERLGRVLASEGLGLVYGGASVGLMGRLADSVLAAGGEVIGVIPQSLVDLEVAHAGLADLRVAASMHERKALMAELADAFIALPGGLGTLDELFEILTWAQLGLHQKPVGALDVGGYFAPLLAVLDRAVSARFLAPAHRAMLLVETDPARLLAACRDYRPPPPFKWIDRPLPSR